MNPSGDYNTVFNWRIQSQTITSTGDRSKAWGTDGGTLLGNIAPETGTTSTAFGMLVSGSSAIIRFRGYPALRVRDRLVNVRWNDTYEIDGIARGDHEIIVQAHKYDATLIKDQ